ncbi:hypothetical protein LJC06_00415 [Bacteroidales bacterium OttesenSCG-928-I14]|nr:hypothetical protein [Bacteroidales bacterium OttesenSCG-928-I14]
MNNERGLAIIEAVKSDGIVDVTKDLTEIIIDGNLSDGIMKDIPVINIAHSLYKIGKGVSDYYYLRKLISFLSEIGITSSVEREKFITKLSNSSDELAKAGNTISHWLSQLDDESKASIMGKLYKGCIEEQFDYETLQRLCAVVNKIFISDLLVGLGQLKANMTIDSIYIDGLLSSGLIRINGISWSTGSDFGEVGSNTEESFTCNGSSTNYGITEIGKIMSEVLF